jgi:hypothetical protein
MKRKKKKEIAKEFGVEFINKDLSKCIEIKRDRNGNPVNHRIKKETKALKELKENTKSWDIVTSTPSHFPLMLLGLELGKDFCGKTTNPKDLRD